jgi:hypothetical protein
LYPFQLLFLPKKANSTPVWGNNRPWKGKIPIEKIFFYHKKIGKSLDHLRFPQIPVKAFSKNISMHFFACGIVCFFQWVHTSWTGIKTCYFCPNEEIVPRHRRHRIPRRAPAPLLGGQR